MKHTTGRQVKLLFLMASTGLLFACGGNNGNQTEQQNQFQTPPPPSSLSSAAPTELPASFSESRNQYTIKRTATGFSVKHLASGVTSNLSTQTSIQFADVSVNLLVGDKSKTLPAASLNTLIELYIAFFNRVPDADGISYWIDKINAGMTADELAASFYNAALQYSNVTGYSSTMSDEEFVVLIYKNVLGRSGPTAPPAADVKYWTNELLNGRSKGALISVMLNAAHAYAGDAVWGWVPQLLDNKVSVGRYFSIEQGLNYKTAEESISKGILIAQAVTPTEISTAKAKIGISDGLFNLTSGINSPDLVNVSIIGMNDFHGNLTVPSGSAVISDPAAADGTRVSVGGAAFLSALITNFKAQNPNTLVVAAGDMLGASPLNSALFHDEPTIDALNAIGLDVSAVGVHELSKGTTELRRLQNGGCFPLASDKSRGVIGFDTCMNNGMFAGAKFQYLTANAIEESTQRSLFSPYTIRTVGGQKIGFIGLTLKDTPVLAPPASVKDLTFTDEVESVNRLVPEILGKGAAAIVVLIHQGGYTSASMVNDKTCPGLSGDIVSIVDRFDVRIDAVISGHTHTEYNCTRPDGKILTQAGFNGRLVSKLDLIIDANTNLVVKKTANNLPVVNDGVVKDSKGNIVPLPAGITALTPDASISALAQRYSLLTTAITKEVLGTITTPIDRTANLAGESKLGDVIADIYLNGSRSAGYANKPAVIAFTHAGGIRNNLNNTNVTFADLFSIMPSGNYLVTLDLTGLQILRLLEQQWEAPQPDGGRIFQVSNGFTYTWDASTPAKAPAGTGARVLPASLKLNGEPISMSATYRVTVNNFMASGGDNYSILQKALNSQAGEIDIDVAVAYFRSLGSVPTPPQNRITRIN